jgi:hypothetical protein
VDVTLARVAHGFGFCHPLRLLFGWVEDQGYVVTGHDGDRYGSLNGHDRRSTQIELRGYTAKQTVSHVRSWFDDVAEDPAERLGRSPRPAATARWRRYGWIPIRWATSRACTASSL